MSTHSVSVIKIDSIEPHPNAETLSIVRIGAYTICVRTQDFKAGDLGIFLEPDYVVDTTRPEFAFLDNGTGKPARIKAKRLRGIVSYGLLIGVPEGMMVKEGDNVMETLGIVRYEPPLPKCAFATDNVAAPRLYIPTYDMESFRKFPEEIEPSEPVIISEKLHGTNARYLWHNDHMWCSSHTRWKKEDEKCLWWQALAQNPWIETWCRQNPDKVLFGEVFGSNVQDLPYGLSRGKYAFAAFDVWSNMGWLSYDDAIATGKDVVGFTWVPIVYVGKLPSLEEMEAMADGDSMWPGANHFREGIVIQTMDGPPEVRSKLKLVGTRYLSR